MAKVEIKLTYSTRSDVIDRHKKVNSSDTREGLNTLDRITGTMERQSERRLSVRNIVKGATGLAKSFAGIDIASDEDIQSRREVCEKCEFRSGKKCGKCGCSISHKTRIAIEACPAGYWGSVEKKTKRSR